MTRHVDSRRFDPDAPEEPFEILPSWLLNLVSTLCMAMGIAVIVFTSQPFLGALLTCARMAWSDIGLAIWVRSQDTNRSRGNAVALFIIAKYLLKVSVLSPVLALFTFIGEKLFESEIAPLIRGWGGNPVQVDVNAAIVRLGEIEIASAVGCVFALIATAISGVVAKSNRIRVWLDGAFYIARQRNVWPPVFDGNTNWADVTVLVGSAIIVTFSLPFFVLSFGMGIIPLPFPLSTIVACIPTAIWFLCTTNCTAGSLQECWGDQLPGAVDRELERT